MVRQKQQPADPADVAAARHKLQEIFERFDSQIKQLLTAKYAYTTEAVHQMSIEFQKELPKDVLNMKMVDFIRQIENPPTDAMDWEPSEHEDTTTMEPQQDLKGEPSTNCGGHDNTTRTISVKTPKSTFPHPTYYKSMNMSGGMHLKIPSCITPRVGPKVDRPRPSRVGEILFSVHGTPVLNTVTAANLITSRKQEALVHNLLQQEDGMLTPETRKIITKLRQLVHKRVDLKGGIATAADADVKTADQQQPTGSNSNAN